MVGSEQDQRKEKPWKRIVDKWKAKRQTRLGDEITSQRGRQHWSAVVGAAESPADASYRRRLHDVQEHAYSMTFDKRWLESDRGG